MISKCIRITEQEQKFIKKEAARKKINESYFIRQLLEDYKQKQKGDK